MFVYLCFTVPGGIVRQQRILPYIHWGPIHDTLEETRSPFSNQYCKLIILSLAAAALTASLSSCFSPWTGEEETVGNGAATGSITISFNLGGDNAGTEAAEGRTALPAGTGWATDGTEIEELTHVITVYKAGTSEAAGSAEIAPLADDPTPSATIDNLDPSFSYDILVEGVLPSSDAGTPDRYYSVAREAGITVSAGVNTPVPITMGAPPRYNVDLHAIFSSGTQGYDLARYVVHGGSLAEPDAGIPVHGGGGFPGDSFPMVFGYTMDSSLYTDTTFTMKWASTDIVKGDMDLYTRYIHTWDSITVSVGAYSAAIKTDGTLWGWGFYPGYTENPSTGYPPLVPARIGSDNGWASVSAGDAHTMAIKTDGSLWAWGMNRYGELGLGGTGADRDVPEMLSDTGPWASVAAGYGHTIALKADGSLWAWGDNSAGQLGLGDSGTGTERILPARVGTDNDWASVSTGDFGLAGSTLALKTDGTLWAWGTNGNGQLGLGYYSGYGPTSPTRVGGDYDWALVSAGLSHTLALKTDGTLWAWGYNGNGELGLGDGSDVRYTSPTEITADPGPWASVSAGNSHTMAVKTDGSLWAWGDNSAGQLGLGDSSDRASPTRVGSDNDWAQVSGGGHRAYTLALKTDGTLWAWGHNEGGQTGLGTYIGSFDTPQPVF